MVFGSEDLYSLVRWEENYGGGSGGVGGGDRGSFKEILF